ncbi:MAG: Ada metal-binding domain-containing protein [Pseudomonadota bacterium]
MQPSKTPTNTEWQALLERTPRANTSIIYAVRTTGIYCRSDCPARKPLRKNVIVFPDTAAARDAAFRACKRCKPDSI